MGKDDEKLLICETCNKRYKRQNFSKKHIEKCGKSFLIFIAKILWYKLYRLRNYILPFSGSQILFMFFFLTSVSNMLRASKENCFVFIIISFPLGPSLEANCSNQNNTSGESSSVVTADEELGTLKCLPVYIFLFCHFTLQYFTLV